MKLFATSDLHGNLDRLDPKDCDLILIAGDVAPLDGFGDDDVRRQVAWMNDVFAPWCEKYAGSAIRLIPGNHDLFAEKPDLLAKVRWAKNTRMLIDEEDEVMGLSIYGTPWVPKINGRWAFESKYREQLGEKFAAIPMREDILLTHTPPRIRHKKIDVSIERNTPHLGSLELTDAILAREPRFVFCGHIHTGDHNPLVVTNHDGSETIVWNVSRLNEDYRICYEPFILEL